MNSTPDAPSVSKRDNQSPNTGEVDFPIAWAELDVRQGRRGRLPELRWIVRACPFCASSRRHSHGAGAGECDPRSLLGYRCSGHSGVYRSTYILKDLFPAHTAEIVAELGLENRR